ncbi:MAG: hypothetical protein ACR2NP_18205 [Pirellulaceae bacterium]
MARNLMAVQGFIIDIPSAVWLLGVSSLRRRNDPFGSAAIARQIGGMVGTLKEGRQRQYLHGGANIFWAS